MDWQDRDQRAALLELWETGLLRKTQKVRSLTEYLLSLGWVTQSGRQKELLLSESGSLQLPSMMDTVWPLWRQTLEELKQAGLPLTSAGLLELARAGLQFPALPPRLHEKTFAALSRAHSKCSIRAGTLPPGLSLTTDGVLRTRPNRGLFLYAGQKRLSCDDLAQAFGEVDIPERAILDGIHLAGALPWAVMTVENLGPFVDMPKPDELFLIHQPGWNTPLSLLFLKTFGSGITWGHFGDLDPAGLAIYQHLQCGRERPLLFIPSFWGEYEKMFSQKLCDPWPETITTSHSEPLLKRLFSANTWLEQEPIILNTRFEEELRQLFGLAF